MERLQKWHLRGDLLQNRVLEHMILSQYQLTVSWNISKKG